MKAMSPPSHANNTPSTRNFCLMPTIKILAKVVSKVANTQGTKMAAGWAECAATRYPIIDNGMSVSPDVCITKNIICALVAVPGLGFKLSKLFMAFNPKGVAALSSPSKLALKFITISPRAGCFSGTSGKRRRNNGLSKRARKRTAPAASAIFMSPRKNIMVPAKGKATSTTASLAVLNKPSTNTLNTSTLPCTSNLNKAIQKATIKKKAQT